MKTLKHHYGENYFVADDPLTFGLLAELCQEQTYQPRVNELVKTLYLELVRWAVANEFMVEDFSVETRMNEQHPESKLTGRRLRRAQKAVVINLARAGTYPSHLCYEYLHQFFDPQGIRQDHIFAARVTDDLNHVVGTDLRSAKIGGGVRDASVIIPDPMGATASTMVATLNHYKLQVQGPAKKYIALHLIVTPEYLKRVKTEHPDLKVYALRVDRGLSAKNILESELGLYWDQEIGLNKKDYIVPGGGGFGEVMNNSFV
jgi:uracil phosphoribosyltransferase